MWVRGVRGVRMEWGGEGVMGKGGVRGKGGRGWGRGNCGVGRGVRVGGGEGLRWGKG